MEANQARGPQVGPDRAEPAHQLGVSIGICVEGRTKHGGKMKSKSYPFVGQNIALAALAYARLGWRVVPVSPNRKKPPLFAGYLDEGTTNLEIVKNWWNIYPGANVGILTGSKSGLIVIDIDPRNGGDASWRRLLSEIGEVDTLSAKTPSGGMHFYFSCKDRYTSQNSQLAPGVDVKAESAYVVAPPSRVAGGRYVWF